MLRSLSSSLSCSLIPASSAALLATLAALSGCGESPPTVPSTPDADRSAAPAERPSWLLASDPGKSLSISDARAILNGGETVVLRGIIGGRLDALSNEAAAFIMIDETVHNPCVADGDDHCPTPWDYCCTSSEVTANASASVRLLGETGKTIMADLRDHGIEELDRVVIVGSVDDRPTPEVLNIRATGLYVAAD